MESKLLKRTYINRETGEVFTKDQIIEITELIDSKNKFKSIKNTNDFINDNLGYYFHLLYGDILKLDLEPQMLIRFLKLCSYSNYENILVTGETKSQRKIKEKELEDILKLSRADYFRTKKYLLTNNLISIEKDFIKIDTRFIQRGKLKGDIKSMEITRIFNKGIQELYDNVKPTQHKKLALFIKILPYINIKYNVISNNIISDNFDDSRPMTSVEVANICGYEKASRFIKDLLSLKINNMFAIVRVTRGDRDFLIVNPKIYYKGNNIEDLKYIMNYFDYK